MHKRTKACSISPKVKAIVEERDNHCCIFCGSPDARGDAHLVNRSQGGLGIEENLLTVCSHCHREMDNGLNTKYYRDKAEEYLKSLYPDWDKSKLVYDKWR